MATNDGDMIDLRFPKHHRVVSAAVLAKYRLEHPCCEMCGSTAAVGYAQNGGVHHIVKRSHGGSDEESNLITLCSRHHTLAEQRMISAEELRSHKK